MKKVFKILFIILFYLFCVLLFHLLINFIKTIKDILPN